MVLDYTSKILQLAKFKPLLPSDVAQTLSSNSIMISAMLSEMVASGKLKVSFLKIGSSPLYYLPENVQMLESFTSHLNEKDRKTVEILKLEGVLQDRALDPLTRVSLRQIKDFAKPLEVTVNGSSEIFWKWFLLSEQDTENIVRKILAVDEEHEKSQPVSSPVQSLSKPEAVANVFENKDALPKPIVKKEVDKKETDHSTDQKFTPVLPVLPQTKPLSPVLPNESSDKFVKPSSPVLRNELSGEFAKLSSHLQSQPIQPSVVDKTKVKETKKDDSLDPFLAELLKFFTTNNILMIENSVVKKNSEIDFILEFDSLFGKLAYYCKARKKKKISASDLYSAFVQGQLKKLPVIFLTNGELTKQAVDAFKNLKGITYKQIPLP